MSEREWRVVEFAVIPSWAAAYERLDDVPWRIERAPVEDLIKAMDGMSEPKP